MHMEDGESEGATRPNAELAAHVVELRDGGRAWSEIQQALGMTRQQARYAYQLGKRAERRQARREGKDTRPGTG